MEKERAHVSVELLTYEQSQRIVRDRGAGKISAIGIVAGLSAIGLIGSLIYKANETIQVTSYVANVPPPTVLQDDTAQQQLAASTSVAPQATSTFDQYTGIGAGAISQLISSYVTLQKQQQYTPQVGQEWGTQIGNTMPPPVINSTVYTQQDFHVIGDISEGARALYQQKLRGALDPLTGITESEMDVLSRYAKENNTQDLQELISIAKDYHAAAANMRLIDVPINALSTHMTLSNALEKFGSTLDAMVGSVADPYASAILLVDHNNAADELQSAFSGIGTYFNQSL